MYEYRTIIYRLQQGQSVRSIAKDGIAGRPKIKEIQTLAQEQGWLDSNATTPDEAELSQFFSNKLNNKQRSLASPYCTEIKEWVAQDIEAQVIHQHLIRKYAFSGAYNTVQRLVKKIKQQQPPNLTIPLHFKPGEVAQIDFGQGPELYDARVDKVVKTWFFVMTLCWSRHQYSELITNQNIESWLNCHQNAFNWFGGVVATVVIDNPKCAITKACYHAPEVQRSYEEFAQGYGFIISACPPREPQLKGRVESGVKYIKKNFVPLRTFTSLQDANQQLKAWILSTAGNRKHGSTFEQPLTRFNDIEQHALKALPETPVEVATWKKVSLYRDCHVRYLKCKYSAPHTLYGEELWLKISQTTVSVYHKHVTVAMHPRKFKPGAHSTKDEHLPLNAQFYLARNASWCLTKSQEIGSDCHFIIENLLTDPVRDLLRQAQSILNLVSKYSQMRLEKACHRARAFACGDYKTIKTILKEGLDYESLSADERFDKLAAIYRGEAAYQRDKDTRH